MTRKIETDYTQGFEGISGDKYALCNISAGRLAYCQEKSFEIMAGHTIQDVQAHNAKVIELLNASKIADASIAVADFARGVESLYSQHNAVMMYCAAIFVTEDEDITKVDEALFAKKVEDWKDIDADFFLKAALVTVPGLLKRWQELAASSEVIRKELINLFADLNKRHANSGKGSGT